MTSKKSKKGLTGLLVGMTLGVGGALAAVFLGKKENREKAAGALNDLKKKSKKLTDKAK